MIGEARSTVSTARTVARRCPHGHAQRVVVAWSPVVVAGDVSAGFTHAPKLCQQIALPLALLCRSHGASTSIGRADFAVSRQPWTQAGCR